GYEAYTASTLGSLSPLEIVGLMASGHSNSDILKAYPYLEEADIYEALAYAAWRVEEIEVPLKSA
ncbi:MAG: DUF433 domain-containing protein, partial [Nostoc sp. ChiSLP02]|nr:DUF433 domain-containing protein [Nostoc sp. ChiSLP02]